MLTLHRSLQLSVLKTKRMKKYSLSLLLLLLLGVLPVGAQIRGNNISVTVIPDHQDWNYKVGETAQFKVSVTKSSTLLDNVLVD